MSFIVLHSGEEFSFEHPERCSFQIEDIAHALSNLCRFVGHTREFYSVAQHSVIVSDLAQKAGNECARVGLMHDTPEAFIGDMAGPLKRYFPDFQELETGIWEAIAKAHGLTRQIPGVVHYCDKQALGIEKISLLKIEEGEPEWPILYDVSYRHLEKVVPLPPKEAKALFLDRYREIFTS